jgi:hypothetical protein
MASVEDELHDAIAGKPVEAVTQQLGIPGSELLASVTTEIPIEGVDEASGTFTQATLALGLGLAVMHGNVGAAVSCLKALAHDWAQEKVKSMITHSLTGGCAHKLHDQAALHALASQAQQTALQHEAVHLQRLRQAHSDYGSAQLRRSRTADQQANDLES